jgi:hypothetical protein
MKKSFKRSNIGILVREESPIKSRFFVERKTFENLVFFN